MSFTPSTYQTAIFNFVKDGEGNALINAVAGSGKTTTLLKAIEQIPTNESILQLAFNKSIVKNLQDKIGQRANVDVMTLHGLGFKAISAFNPCKVNAQKYTHLLNTAFAQNKIKQTRELDLEEFTEYRSNIKRLIDLIRLSLCRSFELAKDIANHHAINLIDNELQVVNWAIKWGKTNLTEVDFTDMVYLPNVMNFPLPKYDWVLIDECQDLNAAQKGLFMECLKDDGSSRFIAVGDPAQAIYGFAGADAESFASIGRIENTQELPLSICYRCDARIVGMAKTLVPQIEAAENAADGTINEEALVADVEDGDAILCRLTAPLTKLCMLYLSEGTKAYIKGKDIGANLIRMVEKTKRTNIDELAERFEKEQIKLATKVAKSRGCTFSQAMDSSPVRNFEDRVQAIEVLGEGLTTCKELIGRIHTIFSDNNKAGICLSTVHKAKGLEWDRVFIACADKFYHERSKERAWMFQQEKNIVYVAYTRAKHYLGFISDFEY